ncbi:hypothetical protein [Methylorubrum suomiense]|uniref:Uncharacterized protein n=1 Tax=Methylorubrum suomiense TaxID=144191 RepID=A0ABQ4V218_9HYPH|nr:hypothetical protein [Methylorubrum suomiense]GJE78645.1 hypothetical protein BGCPKDLD_5263 [Methylorubrum suomiense]
MTEMERRQASLGAYLDAAARGDRIAYVSSLNALDWPTAWIEAFGDIVHLGRVHPNTQRIFELQWQGLLVRGNPHPPSGISIPQIFLDHVSLLVDALRVLLPPLVNEAPDVIYRGQSVSDYEDGLVGFSWTPHPALAEMYARDPIMNDFPRLVLAHFEPANAILGTIEGTEFVVDPRLIIDPKVICRPRDIFAPGQSVDDLMKQCELRPLQDIATQALSLLNPRGV